MRHRKRNTGHLERATDLATLVYEDFLGRVIETHVLTRRIGAIPEKRRILIAKGQYVDARTVQLMSVSAKDATNKAFFTHVTLLDHLLSVTRGAIVLAAQSWIVENPAMDRHFVCQQLALIAVIALLHEIDQDAHLPPEAPITEPLVAHRLECYGIAPFLEKYGIRLLPGQALALIAETDPIHASRYDPQKPLPVAWKSLAPFVRLAEQLEGAWLSSEGSLGVLRCLAAAEWGIRSQRLAWHPVDIFDPHHPFLLDEWQRWISIHSRRIAGIPPLIETHHDGRLFILLPKHAYQDIVDSSLATLLDRPPFALAMHLSHTGVPYLQGNTAQYSDIQALLENADPSETVKLFYLKTSLKASITAPLEALLRPLGLAIQWTTKRERAFLSPCSSMALLEGEPRRILHGAALIALLLKLTWTEGGGLVSENQARERELLNVVMQPRPPWISNIIDPLSRYSLTALWVAALCSVNSDRYTALFGQGGLLQRWIEGEGEQSGMSSQITSQVKILRAAVERHCRQLLHGERIDSIDSQECSGCVSCAEHKLRSAAQEVPSVQQGEMPMVISSPTTRGLFGGLLPFPEDRLPSLALQDLVHYAAEKGKGVHTPELFRRHYRLARGEQCADTIAGQVDQLRMILESALRLGRPFHLFRGLPTAQNAFFYFDAMPALLHDLLGTNTLRLEQIAPALQALQLAKTLLETPGLGEHALRLYASPTTRLAGIAMAWCELKHRNSSDIHTLTLLEQGLPSQMQQKNLQNTDIGAALRLGRTAATLQRPVGMEDSIQRQLMIFTIGLSALDAARQAQQIDRDSLIAAVAGELEEQLSKRQEATQREQRAGKSLAEACLDVAQLLVNDLWIGVLKGRSPCASVRRTLGNIYRMAFLQEQRTFVYQERE